MPALRLRQRTDRPLALDPTRRYDLKAAWRIEYILALAERLNINVLLCFESQQSLQMLFPSSVYASANGGPLESAAEWWTNPAAQSEMQQRLQYAVSRYGHSTAVFAWQLFNEWNDWPGYSVASALPVSRALSAFLREHDVYNHMIQNSFGADPLPVFYPDIDFATFHMCVAPTLSSSPARQCARNA